MLRMYFVTNSFDLADESCEDVPLYSNRNAHFWWDDIHWCMIKSKTHQEIGSEHS